MSQKMCVRTLLSIPKTEKLVQSKTKRRKLEETRGITDIDYECSDFSVSILEKESGWHAVFPRRIRLQQIA